MTELDRELPEGYKMTEIGPLPRAWEVVRLGDVAKISSGGSAPQGDEYFKGEKPFIRVSHIDNEDCVIKEYDLINDKAVQDYKLKLFPKGTIVFPKSGATIYLEKRAMLPTDAYVVSHLCTVIADEKNATQDFLFYLLRELKLAKEKADGYPTLSISEIKQIIFPLPPLPEQRKIAAVLSTVQEAKEKTEAVISAAKSLKKSMMSYLFTYGPVPLPDAENIPQKETEVGMIPEEWEVVRLGDYNLLNKAQYGLSIKGSDLGRYPILRMNNLTNGAISTDDLQFVNLDEDTFRRFKLEKGDVLFNRTNSLERVGKTSVFTLNDDFVFASYLIRLRVDDSKICPFFFNFYFNWDMTQGRLKCLATRGVSQSNISATKLKTFPIPLPPLPEQRKIASMLSAIDEKIEAEENKKKALEDLFNTLLHNLMTARIRVNHLDLDKVELAM